MTLIIINLKGISIIINKLIKIWIMKEIMKINKTIKFNNNNIKFLNSMQSKKNSESTTTIILIKQILLLISTTSIIIIPRM